MVFLSNIFSPFAFYLAFFVRHLSYFLLLTGCCNHLERRLWCCFQTIDVEIVAVVNDAVGALMSAAHSDRNCHVGLILGEYFCMLSTRVLPIFWIGIYQV